MNSSAAGGGLHVLAMIDEFADGNLRSERGEAAEVVAVPVRDDQMIDLREPGVMDRGHDAAGVAHRRPEGRCRCP